jgi:histidine ammonia-lyase
MTIVLDGSSLTIEKLVAIARDNEKVRLDPAALERIKISVRIRIQGFQSACPMPKKQDQSPQ